MGKSLVSCFLTHGVGVKTMSDMVPFVNVDKNAACLLNCSTYMRNAYLSTQPSVTSARTLLTGQVAAQWSLCC